jgi:predicted PurR-regulated permease PerM
MKKSTADDIIEYLQSIYSVLLKSATLISFAVLLFVILIVTTFLALNPRRLPKHFLNPRTRSRSDV